MIKILQVVPSYFPAIVYGGPIYSVHYLAKSISELGVPVNVLTTNVNGKNRLDVTTKKDIKLSKNYHVRYCHEDFSDKFSFQFLQNIPKYVNQSDIVHLHDIFSIHALATILYCCFIRKTIIISPRGCLSDWALRSSKYYLKKIIIKNIIKSLAKFNKIIWHVTSEEEKREVNKLISKANIFQIPNGLNFNDFKKTKSISKKAFLEKYKINLNANKKVFFLGTLGRLHKKKSLDVAINSLSYLNKFGINSILLIAGEDDGMKKKLMKLVVNKKLTDSIFFVGLLRGEQKIEYLKTIDIFLMPSESENFGMVILEALACGKPVVASSNTPWSILNETNAGFCCPNNPESFTESITNIMNSDFKLFEKNALELALQFDQYKIAKRMLKLYNDLV